MTTAPDAGTSGPVGGGGVALVDLLWASLLLRQSERKLPEAIREALARSVAYQQLAGSAARAIWSMMSLSAASSGLGMAIGSGFGGLIFLKYGWRPVGPALGAIGIFASMIFYFLTKDPTQEKQVV